MKSSFHLSIIFDSPATQDTTMESPTVKRVEDLIYRIGRVSWGFKSVDDSVYGIGRVSCR